MKIRDPIALLDVQEQEEEAAVARLLADGTAIPPDVAKRIDDRADRITDEIRRQHGEIDNETIASLFRREDE